MNVTQTQTAFGVAHIISAPYSARKQANTATGLACLIEQASPVIAPSLPIEQSALVAESIEKKGKVHMKASAMVAMIEKHILRITEVKKQVTIALKKLGKPKAFAVWKTAKQGKIDKHARADKQVSHLFKVSSYLIPDRRSFINLSVERYYQIRCVFDNWRHS